MLRAVVSSSSAASPRLAARALVARGGRTASSKAPATATPAPRTVADITVTLNFIDPSGARRRVPGLIGKNLWETCMLHGIDVGPSSCGSPTEAVRSDTWTEPLYGEGTTTGFDHVLLSGNGVETARPRDWREEEMLHEYWDEDEVFPESRLASQVRLTSAMDGMNVYIPDRLVDDIP